VGVGGSERGWLLSGRLGEVVGGRGAVETDRELGGEREGGVEGW